MNRIAEIRTKGKWIILFDPKTGSNWANEKFKSEYEANEFSIHNGLILIPSIKDQNRLIEDFAGVDNLQIVPSGESYFSDWNNIMSVIEEIESMKNFSVNIQGKFCTVDTNGNGHYCYTPNSYSHREQTKKFNVSFTLLEFITRWNREQA